MNSPQAHVLSLESFNMPGMNILVLCLAMQSPALPWGTTVRDWTRPPVTHTTPLQALSLQTDFGIPAKAVKRPRVQLLLAALRSASAPRGPQ